VNLGGALNNAGKPHEALAAYRDALENEPPYPESLVGTKAMLTAHFNSAKILLELGRNDEAIAHLNKFIELAPASELIGFVYSSLADALARSGRHADALPFFEKAVLTQAGDATTHFNWANTLLSLQRVPEAIRAYEKALLRNPAMTEAYLNLGNGYLQLGQRERAIENYEAALSRASSNGGAGLRVLLAAHFNSAKLHLDLGRYGEAMVHLNKFIELAPTSNLIGSVYASLAVALARSGRHAEALPVFQRAILAGAGDATTHFNLATSFFQLGQMDHAIGSYETALRLRPDYPEAKAGRENARAAAEANRPRN
jgi:tetratricopeptide (TPR) repeat protein